MTSELEDETNKKGRNSLNEKPSGKIITKDTDRGNIPSVSMQSTCIFTTTKREGGIGDLR